MSGFGAELGRGNVHGRTTVLALVSMHRTNEAAAHLTNEPEGLAQVLSGLEVTEAESVRLRLQRGAHHTATNGMTLIVVLEGTVIPPRMLAVGAPARVVRPVTARNLVYIRRWVAKYVRLAKTYHHQSLICAPRRPFRSGRVARVTALP